MYYIITAILIIIIIMKNAPPWFHCPWVDLVGSPDLQLLAAYLIIIMILEIILT